VNTNQPLVILLIDSTRNPIQRLGIFPLLILKTKSFSQLPLLPDSFGFLEGTGPFPSHLLWDIPTSLSRSQPLLSSYLCRIKRKKENYSCSACGNPLQDLIFTSFWIVPHLSLSGAPSLALLLSFFIYGPDLGAQPDYWISFMGAKLGGGDMPPQHFRQGGY